MWMQNLLPTKTTINIITIIIIIINCQLSTRVPMNLVLHVRIFTYICIRVCDEWLF